ncbi:hypothetical protein PJV89_03835 [Aliarcobacter butzleri]|uniref:hypothetical protein n=1 Tax=Aliarcobacter butzleri TaxID=28197 RepID=UPI002448BF80|nr:hypothetical protein [Aliarcobacter butzleri]MDH1976105.1 hypothetical protein [Aliarcobacter butzleri]MDN5077411.1 hypothetical protein [Aliarcobacter butzleri]MDN5118527.1 hypothetical protein [Aliarcobacter butzleri]
MATLMEKDVLLEYASVGHLFPDIRTEEMREDSKAMGKLWHRIMKSEPKDIDYEATFKEIKEIRAKYEK